MDMEKHITQLLTASDFYSWCLWIEAHKYLVHRNTLFYLEYIVFVMQVKTYLGANRPVL